MTLNELLNITAIKVTCSDEKETMLTVRDDMVCLYTTDTTTLHKYQKIIRKNPEIVEEVESTHNRKGDVTSVDIYFNISSVNIGTVKPKQKLSEERKAQLAERMLNNRISA